MSNGTLTVGLAQVAPVWLDRERTLEKAVDWIGKAADDGCELVVNSRLVALIAYLQRLGKVPEGEALATATEEAAR